MDDIFESSQRGTRRVLRVVAIVAFLLTLSIALLQIVSRFLPKSIPFNFLWTGALSTNLLVFMIFLGAVLAEIDGGQLRIDILRNQIEARIGAVYELFVLLASLTFTVVVVYGAFLQAQKNWSSAGLMLPWFRTGYLYVFVMVSFASLTALRLWRSGHIVLSLASRARSTLGDTGWRD